MITIAPASNLTLTKFSDHAKRYSDCVNIEHIGWKSGLEKMVEDKKLYPITFLRGLDSMSEAKLGDAGIVTLKQLVEIDADDLWKKTRIPKDKLKTLVKNSMEILESINTRNV